VEPLTELHSKGRLLAWPTNIRLEVTNPLAYYRVQLKSFREQAPRAVAEKARVFAPISHFHPCLIFASKAGSQPLELGPVGAPLW
jgi:hypothetical protein